MKYLLLILNILIIGIELHSQTCSISASTSTLCNGQSSTLTFAHDLPIGSTLLWSPTSQTSNSINVAPTTTTIYSCTVTDGSNSCSSSITITVNSIPTVTSTTPGSRCDAGTVNLSATASVGLVNWYTTSTGGTSLFTGNTYIPTISTTTIYYAEASNGGCTSERTAVTGTVNPTPILSIVNNQSVCAGDLTTTVTFSSNVSGSLISWSNNNTSIGLLSIGNGNILAFNALNSSNTNLTSTITATATANGCTSTLNSFNIVVKPKPVLSNFSNQVLCATELTNPISFSSSVSGATITWTNNNSSIGIPSSGNGNISAFTTTNSTNSNIIGNISAIGTSNGCSSVPMNFNITVKPKPSIANQNSSICSSVLYSPSWVGIIPTNTNYTWSVTNNTQVVGETNNTIAQSFGQTLTNLTLQNQTVVYNVTPVSDGCIGNSFTLNLEVKPAPIANAGQDFTKTCLANTSGNSIGSAPIPGLTYSWSPNSNLSSSTAANPFANPSSTTPYALTVTDILSGCSAIDQVIVTVDNINPIVNAGSDGSITCIQNTSGYTIGISPTANMSYSWNPVNGLASSNSSSTVANPNATTTYTLNAINLSNGCVASDQVVVTVNKAIPTANAGADFIKTCTQNTSGTSIGSSAVLGNIYSWSPSLGINSSTIANPIANPTVSTTYSVLVTNSNNGCTNIDQVTVEVNQTLPLTSAGSDFTKTCISNVFGNSIGMSALPNINYSWSPSIGLTSSNISNPVANPTSTTTYELTSTSSVNGCTATDQVVVSVNNTPPTVSMGTGGTITCNQNTTGVQIGGTNTPGINYSWTPSNALSSTNQSQTLANPALTTTYTLTAQNPSNGCSTNGQVTVNVNNTPPFVIAGLDAIITCNQNVNGVSLGMNTIPGLDYNWSPSTGLNSSNIANVIAIPSSTATYTFTVSNPSNGCSASDNITVFVDNNMPTVNAGLDQSICDGSSVTLSGTSNASNIQWSPSSFVSNPSSLTTTAQIQGNTTFTLTATGTNGCTASDYITISMNELPVSGLNPSYDICANEFLQLNVNPTQNYLWSGLLNSTSNTINQQVDSSGTIILEITDLNGCSSIEEIQVNLLAIPYPIILGAGELCQNSYWEKYSIPSTSNFLHWTVVNGEFQSDSTSNEVYVHWDSINPSNQIIGQIIIEETVASTGCNNSFIKNVLLDTTAALNPEPVLSLSSNVLYIPNEYTFMNWGYESILTHIPVSVGVYSQYCDFNNLDVSNYNYWVEIGDGNGCVTKSYFNEPIFTANLENQTFDKLEVFPNPSDNLIQVKTNFDSSIYQIQTMNGSIVKNGLGDGEFSINIMDLPSGVYILNLNNGTRHYQTKIIKL